MGDRVSTVETASVLDVMVGIANVLESQLVNGVDAIQIEPRMIISPTPPCLDVYPGDPFGEATTFDDGREQLFTIRARVATGDTTGGQELLLELMDHLPGSVIDALRSDRTLDGTVDDSVVEGPSGFIAYPIISGSSSVDLLGCEWRLRAER